ncbi:MAG: flagellar basal body-associated FliL family protein, partial [Burkholderiaceae bacterium]|nr:flagellar basal body-associated FliL family protein [Burkholderiaceae bacterium]
KSPLIMIIVLVVVILLLVVGSIIGTLAVTGFFSEPEQESVEELLKKAEEEKAAAETAESGAEGEPKLGPDGKPLPNVKETPDGPEKQIKSEPDVTKFESRYKEMSRPLIANVAASRKVMSVTVAIMTHYDDKVLTNMDKHEFALRSASLDVLRQVTEADIDKPTFRIELAEKIRLAMNSVLERYEDFGGIEQVLFTEFIIQ